MNILTLCLMIVRENLSLLMSCWTYLCYIFTHPSYILTKLRGLPSALKEEFYAEYFDD